MHEVNTAALDRLCQTHLGKNLLDSFDDAWPIFARQCQLCDLAFQLLGPVQVIDEHVVLIRRGALPEREAGHGQRYLWVECCQNGLKQVVSRRTAIVHEQHAVRTHSGCPKFCHTPGAAFADLWNAVASRQVKVEIPIAADDPHRQRRRLAAMDAHPIESHLVKLVLGCVFVGGSQDNFLRA
jgi:hypothetical protein